MFPLCTISRLGEQEGKKRPRRARGRELGQPKPKAETSHKLLGRSLRWPFSFLHLLNWTDCNSWFWLFAHICMLYCQKGHRNISANHFAPRLPLILDNLGVRKWCHRIDAVYCIMVDVSRVTLVALGESQNRPRLVKERVWQSLMTESTDIYLR